MHRNNIEVRLLIKGRPITEYFHNGNTFVEGRDGSKFEVELINHNSFRVETIVSVDGLGVIDGKEASDRSPGYLLEAGETLRIPGWKLDSEQVASFVFSGKGDSYAAQSTGSSRNSGVIGVMAYREKVHHVYSSFTVSNAFPQAFPAGGAMTKGLTGGLTRGMAPHLGSADTSLRGMTWSSTCAGGRRTASPPTISTSAALNNANLSAEPLATVATAASVNNLGTGFGEAQNFATTTVQFERGDMLAVAVLYYDNARGLKARGIQVGRPSRVRYQQQPQAFPGMQVGCTPPPNWQG